MKRYVLKCRCNVIVDTCEETPKETCGDCKQAMTVEECTERGTYTHAGYFKNLKDSLRMEKEDRNELPS